jgi:hypothetical protein
MEIYCWKCPLCGIEESAEDSGDAKAKLEVHEKEAHKGKPVGSFGGSWKPEPLIPYWPKVPIKVFANGTYTVGGVKHEPTSASIWKKSAQ